MPFRLKNMPTRSGSLLQDPSPVAQYSRSIAPTSPRDLDIGVIYSGERDLMSPLLSTMKASAPGLDYRLILIDNHSPHGIEPWRQIVPQTKVLAELRGGCTMQPT